MSVYDNFEKVIAMLPEKRVGTCCGFYHPTMSCERAAVIAERFGYTEIVMPALPQVKELTNGS
jgi:hypothetical protein